MKNNKGFVHACGRVCLVPALAVFLSAFSGVARASDAKEAQAAVTALQRDLKKKTAQSKTPGALAGFAVSFKVDPRLTKGMYMGGRWVSPPTYVGTNGQDTVQAKVTGIDAKGVTLPVQPKWIPADPERVTVTPSEGDAVTITVKRAGQTSLTVASQGVSKKLTVKAAQQDNVIRVEITQ